MLHLQYNIKVESVGIQSWIFGLRVWLRVVVIQSSVLPGKWPLMDMLVDGIKEELNA